MKNKRRTIGLAALVTCLVAVTAWYRFVPGEVPPGQPPLGQLDTTSLRRLQTDFNRHAEETRLILLLSPT